MTQQVWNEKTGKIVNAIIFYCLLLVVQAGLELYQYYQTFDDLSHARGLGDLMKVIFGSTGLEDIIVQILLLIAYIWLVSAIKSFGSVQEDLQTKLSLEKVGRALWLNFAAAVVAMSPIPLFFILPLISLIMEICSYAMMVSGFRYLMSSPVFNAVARSGAGTLKSYAVWSIWGILPFIGGLFRFIAWIQFIRGWSNMRGGSPLEVVPLRNSVNVVYVEPQLPTDEYISKANAKTDEELKVILQHKSDYHPQLVKAAEKILLDRITGVAEPEIVTPVNDEDRNKAYQPSAYQPTAHKEEIVQSPVKSKDDSFDVVQEAKKPEISEESRSVTTSQSSQSLLVQARKKKLLLGGVIAAGVIIVGVLAVIFISGGKDTASQPSEMVEEGMEEKEKNFIAKIVLFPNYKYDFKGEIGGKYPVTMTLMTNRDLQTMAIYSYDKDGYEYTGLPNLQFDGHTLSFSDFASSGKTTIVEGKATDSVTITGTWCGGLIDKELPFSLKMVHSEVYNPEATVTSPPPPVASSVKEVLEIIETEPEPTPEPTSEIAPVEVEHALKQAEELEDRNAVLEVAETMPEFSGGKAALQSYLAGNLKYPKKAQDASIEGRVVVLFVVGRDGSINNASVVRSVDPELDKEALRVVNGMPHWKPGMQKGEPVRVKYTMPIMFRLQ